MTISHSTQTEAANYGLCICGETIQSSFLSPTPTAHAAEPRAPLIERCDDCLLPPQSDQTVVDIAVHCIFLIFRPAGLQPPLLCAPFPHCRPVVHGSFRS